MCYPKPGPRCSSHALASLLEAQDAFKNAATESQKETTARRLRKARKEYYATPAGINLLKSKMLTAMAASRMAEAQKYGNAVRKFEDLRASQIAAMKAEGFKFDEAAEEAENKNLTRCGDCGQFVPKSGSHNCPGVTVDHSIEDVEASTSRSRRRTDAHAPSAEAFDPQKYEPVAVVQGFSRIPAHQESINKMEEELRDQGYTLGNGDRGHCGHCGTRISYAAVLKRPDIKEFIYVGETCLSNRFSESGNGWAEFSNGTTFSMTKRKFDLLRKENRLNRARQKRADSKAKLLELNPELKVLEDPNNLPVHASSFTKSIARQLHEKGTLTNNQIAAVKEALVTDKKKYLEEQEEARKREAEKAATPPAPLGEYTFLSKILKITTRESKFGYRNVEHKMLVKSSEGWTVWLTAPASIRNQAKVGDNVYLTADLTPTADDPKHAWGSRPREITLIPSSDD